MKHLKTWQRTGKDWLVDIKCREKLTKFVADSLKNTYGPNANESRPEASRNYTHLYAQGQGNQRVYMFQYEEPKEN